MKQISTKKTIRLDWLEKMIHWELCKQYIFDYKNQWHMQNPESVLKNETQNSLEFWDTNGSSNLGQTTRPCDSQQQQPKKKKKKKRKKKCQERICWIVKKNRKVKRILDELKKLWKMTLMLIPIIINILGTIPKGLVKGLGDLEIRGQVETMWTTALLRSVRILWRVLETWRDLLSLILQWKPIR